uniref:Fatty acid synthase n=1 Tax=Parastrongyloides trichosuri TaxID=131310 RepID=A0A0N4ZB91_PARTI
MDNSSIQSENLSASWERVSEMSSNSNSSASMNSAGDAPFWRGQEDIVITGVSGRFPRSENVAEFGEHLFAGEDLITEDDLRWPPGYYDLPKRHGKLKDLKKFDAQFFGVTPKQANYMDPQVRLLLEVAYEAMIDAGINPQDLRGTKTGVFVGCSASETGGALTQDPETVTGYTLTGCVRSMFSNRLSFAFDLRGPSFSVDTACSSSMCALQLAIDAMRQDQCDAAIVAGAHLTLTPTAALQFLRLGMLSDKGSCRSFDESGDGYCRTEGVAAILLQRAPNAKRVYATVVHAKSNTDGYKEQGITFPSGERQAALLEEVYREANVDPNTVTYVETHGTGTKVGDPQEANAICNVFCSNRTPDNPLLIGSVKSNMGHAEPASGLCSIAKVLLAMERNEIPPNLHFKEPNPYIPGLSDGRLKVVSEKTPFKGGYVGINSFGFGGSNTHVLLKAADHKTEKVVEAVPFPKLLIYSGRTQESVNSVFKNVEENKDDNHFHALLYNQADINPKDTPYRGFMLINRKNTEENFIDIQKVPITESRPVWFVYSGMGSQWSGMAQELMSIPLIDESLRASSKSLESYGVDVYKMLKTTDATQYQNNTLNCMLAISAIQIAITDLLIFLGVVPDGIIGHSTGEMGCGYADGALTREQTMKLAYHRGKSIMTSKLPIKGGMAAVGLTWEEAFKRCPEGIVPACHNGADSVTISGEETKVKQFVEELTEEKIFAKFVDSSGIPFHSPIMLSVKDSMLSSMKTAIIDPKPRSSRWISTSIPESEWDCELAQTSSAEYHVNNACSPVLFYEALQKIPPSAVVVEIAPHALLQAVLRRNVHKTCTNIGMINSKAGSELECFLQSIGKIYQAGTNIKIQKLYPEVSYPVPKGTPMIGPMWKWDHSQDWPVVDGKMMASGGGGQAAASASYNIDPFSPDSKETYLLDHCIDGRVLYPFTGHMVLAWKTLCKLKGVDFQTTPIVLENINVYKATILTKPIRLDVVITPGNGNFEILDDDQICASGRIYIPDETQSPYYNNFEGIQTSPIADRIELDTEDAYKEFLLRGYEYGQAFRGIYRVCNSGERGTLYWNGNWVTFLDSLLQTALLAERADSLRLPTRIRYLRIDPNKQIESIVEKDGIQVIELRNDIATNGCTAGGVECCDLTSHTVSRRMQISGQLFTEKIHFVKHFDLEALKEFSKDAKDIDLYKKSLKALLLSGLKEWKKNGFLNESNNDKLFTIILSELEKNLVDKNVATEAKYLEETQYSLFITLDDIFKLSKGKEDDASDLENNITNKIKGSYKIFDNDKLWGAAFIHDRILKSVQDIVIENSAGHKNRCIVVDMNSTDILKYCIAAVNSHPLLELEWTVGGNNVNELDENTLTQLGAKKQNINFDSPDCKIGDVKNFDYMVLDRVLNQKEDPLQYIDKCCEILRDDGFIIINEYTHDFEFVAAIEALSGRQFSTEVTNERKYGAFYNHSQLLKLFEKANLSVACYQSDPSILTTMYAVRKIPKIPRDPVFVNVDDVKDFEWVEDLKGKIEERLNEPDSKTIWLVSDKVRNNGVIGMALCFNEENLKHNRFRTFCDISTDPKIRDGPPVISIDSEDGKRILNLDLHANNYKNGEWGSMRHIVVKDEDAHVYKECEHAFINTLVRGDVSSLKWFESPNQYFDCVPNKSENVNLCSVYYAAINFRDVMLAYGRLPPDAIPGNFADRECLLGMEFSGRLPDGKRLMGILPAQALATSVIVDTEYAWEVPDNWTLAEAATVPVVYATAYYALIMRGQIQKGDTVLIHGGSGGVGQAAIAIALAYGCEVYTTVGSEEKREFLKKRFPQLTDKNFANSRKTDFETYIRRVTYGRGVDVILNSLAQEMLQASVRCLAQHGRFLEIGKVDLSQNTALGMAVFLKNVTFHGILLDAVMDTSVGKKSDWLKVAALLQDGITSGVVQPLPYSSFSSEKAEDAFRFMSAGKHIGKVLMKIREEEEQKICLPSQIKVNAICRTLCNPTHCYLITGGLGGFGLELAQWLINRGARNIVLTSRSGIRTGYQARCVHFWRRTGINIMVSTLNISSQSEAFSLIQQCQELGPIGGIFHLAMVLRDCLFENQNVQNFRDAAEAKYYGTINLDIASRKLVSNDTLRWFVVFSSITSGRGNAGQTNYGWSNSTMERMIEQRREDGYPGIAVQWGAIGDVGVILENMGDNNTIVGGTLPQRMPSCLATFDLFLSWDHAVVSSYIKAETGNKKSAGGGNLLQTIAHILGVNDVSQLNPDANLGDLGLDSLMGVEIKQALERDYDIVLSMKDIRTLTLNKLQQLAETGGVTSEVLQSTETDLMKESEREAEQNTVEVLEKQMNQLFKMRVDVNDLEPEDMLVKCNKVEEGPKVFFLHSIEGIATPLKKVMKNCKFPAYCFQATKSVPDDSIESVAKRYIKEMKKIQPEGPWRLVGYSYGACIGFEMATQLQEQYGDDSVERLILLDGSHLYMQTYRNVYRSAFGVTGDTLVNNPLFESEIMCAMTLRFANVDYKKFRIELLQLPGFRARIQKVVETVMTTDLFKSPDTIQFACEAMHAKFLMADKYKPSRKFNGLITLIRAEQGAAREEDVGQDYGISQVSDDSKVFVVEGDHDSFVQGKTSTKTVELINSLIAETYKH